MDKIILTSFGIHTSLGYRLIASKVQEEELKQQKTARVVSFKGLPNRNLHGFSSHTHTHIPLTYLLAYKLFMENEREKGAHSE